jgi:predicted nucleic acid-binding protein
LKLALDTNAYRALREGDRGLAERVRVAEAVALPVIVVGELRFGFQNGTRLAQNEELLERFLGTPRAQVLHITIVTTWLYGEVATVLRARGVTLQQNDIWIAALCKQHQFALATRDRGFQQVIGLQVIGF